MRYGIWMCEKDGSQNGRWWSSEGTPWIWHSRLDADEQCFRNNWTWKGFGAHYEVRECLEDGAFFYPL